MASFEWKGFIGTEVQSGTIEADGTDEAAYELRKRGLIITHLDKISVAAGTDKKKFSLLPTKDKAYKPLTPKDVVIFTKKLSTMVKAGLTLVVALRLMSEQISEAHIKRVCDGLLVDVENGQALSDALKQYPEAFDTVYINLVRAGEASGRLDFFLQKLQENLEKALEVRATIKKALFYPSILLTVTIVVVGIMLIFVVPIFAELFESAGSELPALTAAVMSVSHFVQDPMRGGLLLLFIVLGVVAFRQTMRKDPKFRRKVHYKILNIPLFGDLIVKSAMAKVAMIMSNLTAAGAPLLDSVDICESSMSNIGLAEALSNVRNGLYEGRQISELFAEQRVIPDTFGQLLSVGEETGNMEDMYQSVANYYQEEVNEAVSSMTSLLEPVMIVFMGLTVGFIIVAMYLPIFSMGDVIGG